MADNALGLFGMTPQALMAARQAAVQKQAQDYAQMSPIQQGLSSLYQAGNQLGSAFGGLMGVQDPELQKITKMQEVAKSIDPTSVSGLAAGARALLEAGFPAEAQALMAKARDAQLSEAKVNSENALAAQRLREKQAAGLDEKLFLELAKKSTPESVAAAQKAGNDLSLLSAPLTDKVSTYGRILMDAGYAPGSPEFMARMEAYADAEMQGTAKGKGATINNVLPSKAGDVVGLRKDINTVVKPYRDATNSANEAIELADDVLKTGNFASFKSLARSLAKASGETQLSAKDVAAFDGDPSLIGSIADAATTLAKGTPTKDTVKQLKALAVILRNKNQRLENIELEQMKETARMSGNFKEEDINKLFTLGRPSAPAAGTQTTKSGTKYTVEQTQ